MLQNDREGKVSCLRDEEGYIFIDRNGKAFATVLEYLRTGFFLFLHFLLLLGHIFLPPDISKEQIDIEFDFYQINVHSNSSPNVALKLYSETGPDNQSWIDMMENFWNSNWSKMYQEIKKAVTQGNAQSNAHN